MEYVGNFHIHSLYSDGHKSIKEIAAIAARCRLDFIIITDHGTLKGQAWQGYQKGVLVLTGMEINDYANHYLAMDINQEVEYNTECPQQVIDQVNRLGGFGVIAHPIEKGSPFYENGRTYPWLDWNVSGFQGIEIWNFLSQWRDGITGFFRALWLLFRPVAGLTGPYPELMFKLDQYHKQGQPVMFYGGADAHGDCVKIGIFNIKISPYDLCFKMINVHIITESALSGNEQKDIKLVYTALRQGLSWVACDYYKSSRGFVFELRSKHNSWLPGQRTAYQDGMYLYVYTPFPARVLIIKDGQTIRVSYGNKHILRNITSGVYRAEIYIRHLFKYRSWIFPNPIWVEQTTETET